MIEQSETFECYRYPVKARAKNPITLIPFGDIHHGGKLLASDKWYEFLAWAKTVPNALFLGMGDYTDMLSGSERKAIRKDELHDQSIDSLEEFYLSKIDTFYKDISFMKGKVLGLLEGNHHIKFESGETSTQMLCRMLKTKSLGNQAFVKLKIDTGGGRSLAVVIFAAHGITSSARTVSGGMGAVEKMEFISEADLYLQGHSHQRGALPFSKLHLIDTNDGKMKVIERKGYFVRTGSFMRSYVPGARSYAANRLMRPGDLGVVPITITPAELHNNTHLVVRLSVTI